MSETLLTIACAVIGSGSATAFVTFLLNKRAEKKRIDAAENQGIRWLLQDRLEHLARKYISDGSITYEELKNWNKGHGIYHEALGGNGDLNNVKSALEKLYQKGTIA